MKNLVNHIRQDEQGFTLVELAVVMIIIGILIGGILKGQELITNARVTSTISQMEALSAAKNDFQNQYNAIPGDMNDAVARIGQCGAAACVNGDGNSIIGVAVGGAAAGESMEFYRHLLGAGYITGLDGQANARFGEGLPTAPVGGGFTVGQRTPTQAAAGFTNANMQSGVWIVQNGVPTAVVAGASGVLTGLQASRIDGKLDDGVANRGGLQGDTACVAGNTYVSAPGTTCAVAYRI